MGLSCAAYKSYDWIKRTWLGTKLFYGGIRFRHFSEVTLTGTIKTCVHSEADGDCSFDLCADGPLNLVLLSKIWHLELTPCQSASLHAQVKALTVGTRVQVTGIRTFDPSHHIATKKFLGGGWEIHPLTAIQILKDEKLEAR